MPIGKVWIYRLLFFVCFFCVCDCMDTDSSTEDKASGVTFCSAVRRLPRQGITNFCELCSPRSSKLDELASARAMPTRMYTLRCTDVNFTQEMHHLWNLDTFAIYCVACGRRIGMCGYTSVPFTDVNLLVNTFSLFVLLRTVGFWYVLCAVILSVFVMNYIVSHPRTQFDTHYQVNLDSHCLFDQFLSPLVPKENV